MTSQYHFCATTWIELVNGDVVVRQINDYILAEDTVEAQEGAPTIIRDLVNDEADNGVYDSPVSSIKISNIQWGM